MPKQIRASIVVTCFNKERYVSRAINSCINQNFPENQFEVIIVDDGSTDRSREAISLYTGFGGYHFIRTTFLRKNMGAAYASNVGMRMAHGKYLVFVDADDYIHRDFLKVMTEVLEWNPEIGFVYCDLIVVPDPPESERKLVLNTLGRLLNHGAAVVYRKEHLKALGGWDESLRNCYDYDLLLRYRKKYGGYHLRLPYYRYFKEGSDLSTQSAERKRLQKMIRARHVKK
jgi:glycosyltransferase involved in cell wall biosynthesis